MPWKKPTRDVQAEIGYLLLLICTYMYPLLGANMLTKIFFAYVQVHLHMYREKKPLNIAHI